MPDQTFMDFFAGQRMTLLAQSATIKPGIPRVLPDPFYTPGPTRPFDDKVQWPAITWNRGGATVVGRGSPPRPINLGADDWKFATVMNMKEEWDIGLDFMQALVADYAPIRQNAMAALNTRILMFNERFETTRINMVHSMFALGAVYIGSDGQVLASSSGAKITLDANIATGNKITKDGAGSTYNIGDWSSASTLIRKALSDLDVFTVKATGYIPTTILYGASIPDYLVANTSLKDYFIRNPGFRDALVSGGDIPQGFLGKRWIPARLAFLVKLANVNDTTGTATSLFADNFIGVMPDLSPQWYEFVEGGTQVINGVAGATQVAPNATMQQMLAMFSVAYGKYSYGVVKSHPVTGISMVQGDCCGPVIKTPGAYMFGTVS